MEETMKKTDIMEQDIATEEKPKAYEFRQLASVDMFPMFKIISKIGVNEFTDCMEKDAVKNVIAAISGKATAKDVKAAGIAVTLEVVNVLMTNLPKCESDIFSLLASTSNLSEATIKKMPMADFAEMVIDFVKKEDFADFIKVVSKLFK